MPTIGVMVAAALALASPAAAEGLIEFMVNGFRVPPATLPANVGSPTDLLRMLTGDGRQETVRGSGGPHAAYCVRLCDGRYFPVQANRSMSAAAQCNTFCPASATRIFSGSEIDRAVAADGRRYADLPNAFAYRKRMVPGCTCNGSNTVGVAPVPVADDPTLRPGDIVATNAGLTVYNGRSPHQAAAFTPLDDARVSKSLRNRLADVKVTPQPPQPEAEPAVPDETSSIPANRPRFIARAP